MAMTLAFVTALGALLFAAGGVAWIIAVVNAYPGGKNEYL